MLQYRYLRERCGMVYNVLLTRNPDNGYTARVLAWPEMVVTGDTREEVLVRTRTQILQQLAGGAEIVQIEVEPTEGEHPWMRYAGMWEDDSTFNDFQARIEAYRYEIDAEASQE
ncbi:MAG: hypothetical protein A2Z04_02700 [Chloroflexi bacterium RBG_16_57_9]|nr:MAG: hypothetical protein A2Z04_02700 [Chloroflexi bacterium RBG_16_57_9]